jgi:hypothetical protein
MFASELVDNCHKNWKQFDEIKNQDWIIKELMIEHLYSIDNFWIDEQDTVDHQVEFLKEKADEIETLLMGYVVFN